MYSNVRGVKGKKSSLTEILHEQVAKWLNEIKIDEDGMIRVKGKNETDHITITMYIEINNLDHVKILKEQHGTLGPRQKNGLNMKMSFRID